MGRGSFPGSARSPGAGAAAGRGSPLAPVPGGPRPQELGSRSGLPGRNVPSPRLPPPTFGCCDGSRNLRTTHQLAGWEPRSIPCCAHRDPPAEPPLLPRKRVGAVHARVDPEAPGSPSRQVKASPPLLPTCPGSLATPPGLGRGCCTGPGAGGGAGCAPEADPDPGGAAVSPTGSPGRRPHLSQRHRPRVVSGPAE